MSQLARWDHAAWLQKRLGECRRRTAYLESALTAICTTSDSGPWIDVYRAAGGGYEGLQAIAERALAEGEDSHSGPTA